MDSELDESLCLEDQLHNCRCCLRILLDDQKVVRIDDKLRNKFHEISGIKLIESEALSNKVCTLCSRDLNMFSQFRREIVRKQMKLLKALSDSPGNEEEPTAEHNFDKRQSEFTQHEIESNLKSEDDEEIVEGEIEALDECMEMDLVSSNFAVTVETLDVYHCDNCSFVAESKSELTRHNKAHHKLVEPLNSAESNNFTCELCLMEFEKRHLLNRHIRLKHTVKERKYSCQYCDKSFHNSSNLKKHEESHGDKEIPCEYCDKKFTCMNNLRSHLYYHAEPKFVCPFAGCEKRFFMRKLLRVHVNTHTGKKDFNCEYCDKKYFFHNHLKRHIRSSHMKLKIFCEVSPCSSNFARKETYRTHVMQHHKDLGTEKLKLLLQKIKDMKEEDYTSTGVLET